MSATTTLSVLRGSALQALAEIENAGLDDDEIAARLNAAMASSGHVLTEVSITHWMPADDLAELRRITSSIVS